jgi:hypothetical protein
LKPKRNELEKKRKSLLIETTGEIEVTLEQVKMCPGELQVTKELLHLRLFQLALPEEQKTFPLCLETRPLGEQSLGIDLETKQKKQHNQRKEEENKRKDEMKMTK